MHYDLMMSHPVRVNNLQTGWGIALEEKNDDFLNSICDYFTSRIQNEQISYSDSVWESNISRQSNVISALLNRDLNFLHENLKNLFSSELTHGMAQGDDHFRMLQSNEHIRVNTAQVYYDKFISLMELADVITTFSPEEYFFNKRFDQNFLTGPDVYLTKLMEKYKCDLTAPKYSGNLFGLTTKYGLYNERDIMSLGVALMIQQKFPDKNINICEIGGGVGHLAYYLMKLGYSNISIVDLPTISVAQMYFLGVNAQGHNVKLLSPLEFTGKHDLVVNVDSMTEMNKISALQYCQKMKQHTKNFVSINHETHPFTVSQICEMRKTCRHPFWLRRGYVYEEFVGE
jgi:hypothetical protein